MRLHALTLEAFGPFPGREHIDFDSLDHGILLVNGPTGSGKSSLLDAVTFALFGDVAGVRRTLRQSLRSHHAPPEREPSVELIFSVGTTRWKIRRVPQWEAPKRRGAGMTTRHATVQLSQWRDTAASSAGAWHLVSSRIDEAADMIKDTLGMGLDQFAQVVLLPQGEFAEFLRARPEDRRTLLERLFDVERFDAVERWFTDAKNERARASESSLTAIQGHLNVIADTLTRLDSDDLKPLEWSAEAVDELPELMRQLLTRTRRHCEAAVAQAEVDAARATAAERACDRANTLLTAQQAYARALARLSEWPQEKVDELRRAIEAATAVSGVLTLVRRRDAARAESRRADEVQTKRLAALEELTDRTGLADEQLDEVLPSAELTAQIDLLRQLTHELGRMTEDVTVLEAARTAADAADSTLEEAQRSLSSATDANEAAAAALVSAQDELEATPDVSRQVESVNAALAHVQRARERSEEVERAVAERTRCLTAYVDAEGLAVRLRTARLNGMAAELAGGLQDGEPCPVCGSCTHPSPTQPEADAPSEDDIASAEEVVRRADAQRIAAETQLSSARSTLEATLGELQKTLDILADEDADALEAEELLHNPGPLDVVRQRLNTATAHRAQVAELHERRQAELTAAQARSVSTQAAHTKAQSHAEAAVDRVARAQARVHGGRVRMKALMEDASPGLSERFTPPSIAADEPDLPQLRSDLTDLTTEAEKQQRHVQRVVEAVNSASQARTNADAAQQRADAAEQDLADELLAKGYDDVASVQAVALDESALEELRSTWQHAIELRAAAEATMRDDAVAAAAMTPPPDEGHLRRRAELLTRRAAAARAGAATWSSALAVLESMRDKVADAVRAHLPLADAAHEMQELANTFSGIGENTHRMRLTSYVLAAHLEAVTTMANERLDRMTDGRYQLRYTDERAKGNQRSGLGLAVVDAWTGRSRDTATLSGGEAFMASLALALGLGDAVRADSGGMELNTLFVDEGFGSLDQDTLEHVMEVLDGLREGGRLVGVVSHVSELRARIPTHIDVRKTSEGSSIHSQNVTEFTVSEPA